MSTVTPASPSSLSAIPATIRSRLKQLRGQMTRFVVIDGLSRLALAIIVIALVDMAIDRLFKMDQAQRLVMLLVMIGAVGFVFFWRLLRPLLQRVGDDALILQVEDHHQETGESLISSVQFSRDRNQWRDHGYSEAFVDAAIREGSGWAERIDFARSLNVAARNRNLALLIAAGMAIAVLAWSVVATDFGRTWFNRNILLTNDQWPRNTRLQIVGAENGQMVLPRGEDHNQLVEVDETSRIADVDVTIEFDDGNTRTRQKMRKTDQLDGRQHMLVFRNLAHPFRFRASGGDDTTEWVRVDLVDPPGWSELQLDVIPPAYTGASRETLPDGGGPFSILEGSVLEIRAVPNKPLGSARLVCGEQALLPQRDGDTWHWRLDEPDLVGGKYTFDLEDSTGMRSSRPASFAVRIKPDRPPRVRANLLGISGLVVPRARIPVAWSANDEFAINRAEFEYSWSGDSPGSVPSAGAIDLTSLGGETGALIGRPAIRTVDVLDLEPLSVPTGVGLNLNVAVVDNNTRSGPGVGKSRAFLLRVVTEDELRSDLLRREIEQRKAFELVLKNQEELQVDLRSLAANASQGVNQSSVEATMLGWQRRQKLVGTNIATIADRFEEFLVEVKNNRLDEAENRIDASRSIEVRFNDRIIEPIRQLDQTTIIEAVQLLDQSQRRIGSDGFVQSLQQTADKQERIISSMQQILAAMQDSETYQEVVNLAIEVKRRQEGIRDLTREQQNQAGAEDIFDDAPQDLFDDSPADPEPDPSGEGQPDDGRDGNRAA